MNHNLYSPTPINQPPIHMIQIKHNKLRTPSGGKLTSWLFTQRGGVEFGATKDKSI